LRTCFEVNLISILRREEVELNSCGKTEFLAGLEEGKHASYIFLEACDRTNLMTLALPSFPTSLGTYS
jgi:hypothetical protein